MVTRLRFFAAGVTMAAMVRRFGPRACAPAQPKKIPVELFDRFDDEFFGVEWHRNPQLSIPEHDRFELNHLAHVRIKPDHPPPVVAGLDPAIHGPADQVRG